LAVRTLVKIVMLSRRLEERSWRPTEEQMRMIAKHYGLRAIIVQQSIHARVQQWIPVTVAIGGAFYPSLKSLIASNYRSFWHELGHAAICRRFGTKLYILLRNISAAQFPIVVALAIFGLYSPAYIAYSFSFAFGCWFLEEVLSNVIGLKISHYWEKKDIGSRY